MLPSLFTRALKANLAFDGRAAGSLLIMLVLVRASVSILTAQTPAPPAPAASTMPGDPKALREQSLALFKDGKPVEALPLMRRALELLEARADTRESLETAAVLTDLAELCRKTSKVSEALTLGQRGLAMSEQISGPQSLATARSLMILGRTNQTAQNYPEAEALDRRAVAIMEKSPDVDPKDYSSAMNNLGVVRYWRGDFAQAETYDLRAIAILEKAFGPDPAPAATTWSNLSQVYLLMGNMEKAAPAAQRGFDIQEKALGPDHPGMASPVASLGSFYAYIGDYPSAERLFARSVELYRKENKGDNQPLALSLSGLGQVRMARENYQGALAPTQEAVAMMERVLGPEKADVAKKLADLGEITADLGDDAGAEALYRRALGVWTKDPDTTYQDSAYTMGKLAELRAKAGSLDEAETLSRQALAILEKEFGPANPDRIDNLRRLARWRTWKGFPEEGAAFAIKAQENQDTRLASVLSFATQQQRMEFQRVNESWSLLATLGQAGALADAVLRYKGVVLDSLLEDRLTAAASEDPATRGRIEEGRALQRELTQLRTDAPEDSRPDGLKQRDAKLAETARRLERLESDMARAVAGLGRARRSLGVTAGQVSAALPAGTTLVEFARYNHDQQGKPAEARYGAVILHAGGTPTWVPLGAAKPIDDGLTAYRDGVREGSDDLALEEALGTLGRLVWAPVGTALPTGTREVIISPDGELNFLSFATLLTSKGEFLGEKYHVAYVSSGRDLVASSDGASTAKDQGAPGVSKDREAGHGEKKGLGGKAGRGTMVVFANPKLENTELPGGGRSHGTELAMRGPNRSAFRDARFAPLPGAEIEGRDLAGHARKWGWKSELFTGAEATEARLSSIHSPRVLHLATHGFFLPPPEPGKDKDAPAAVAARLNPMDRAGLALAGAASTLAAWGRGEIPRTSDDGIVTAEEVSALDLRDTWLVTLSACESGGGEARSGEGVLGLRRGFALAGARNLLLTLWPVPDKETTLLMLNFYAAAERTDDPARALAETQRDLLVKLRREQGVAPAVRLAGAFILSSRGR